MWSEINEETGWDMKEMGRIKSFGGGDIQQKEEAQNFGHEREDTFSVPPLVANPDPSIKNTLKSVLCLITVIILKKVREYFLSKLQIYSI